MFSHRQRRYSIPDSAEGKGRVFLAAAGRLLWATKRPKSRHSQDRDKAIPSGPLRGRAPGMSEQFIKELA